MLLLGVAGVGCGERSPRLVAIGRESSRVPVSAEANAQTASELRSIDDLKSEHHRNTITSIMDGYGTDWFQGCSDEDRAKYEQKMISDALALEARGIDTREAYVREMEQPTPELNAEAERLAALGLGTVELCDGSLAFTDLAPGGDGLRAVWRDEARSELLGHSRYPGVVIERPAGGG